MTLSDEGLKNLGVQDTSLVQSLGVFLVAFLAILIALLVYYAVKNLAKSTNKTAQKLLNMLRAKLFYSSFFRYSLQSNIKLTYTFWAFFLAYYSLETVVKSLQTLAYTLTIVGLIAWPLYIAWFVYKNQEVLKTKEVKQKYSTLYDEIEVDSKMCLFYNVIFCVRRFDIVFINVIWSENSPLRMTDGGNNYLFKIFSFLIIQTIYVIYILETMPHTHSIYNYLEVFNECLLILLTFIMVTYSGVGAKHLVDDIQESMVPQIVSLVIVGAASRRTCFWVKSSQFFVVSTKA